MPRLLAGDYSITVAVADGNQDDHVQHHWIHDALFFKSESTSVAGGLIGLPMNRIKLQKKETP
jgi:lipopolysaccharide transport system ATP-binding protein